MTHSRELQTTHDEDTRAILDAVRANEKSTVLALAAIHLADQGHPRFFSADPEEAASFGRRFACTLLRFDTETRRADWLQVRDALKAEMYEDGALSADVEAAAAELLGDDLPTESGRYSHRFDPDDPEDLCARCGAYVADAWVGNIGCEAEGITNPPEYVGFALTKAEQDAGISTESKVAWLLHGQLSLAGDEYVARLAEWSAAASASMTSLAKEADVRLKALQVPA